MLQYNPRQVADISWAMGTGQYYDYSLLQAIKDYSQRYSHVFAPIDLARALWGLGRLHFCDDATAELAGILVDKVARVGG